MSITKSELLKQLMDSLVVLPHVSEFCLVSIYISMNEVAVTLK